MVIWFRIYILENKYGKEYYHIYCEPYIFLTILEYAPFSHISLVRILKGDYLWQEENKMNYLKMILQLKRI